MSSPTTCHHLHTNGALCKSPPLRHRDYCHFHLDQIGRQLRAARARARHQPASLKLPLLEDPFAVQVALMQVADAITHNEIDVQRGRMLMSVLRLASSNLRTARAWKHEPVFAADADTAMSEWPGFEQENGLPPDFDVRVDPEVAFPPSLPLNPNDGLNGAPERDLRTQIRQALGEAQDSRPLVTADQVELMEIYERDGQEAATKFANQMVRNDRRRERRLQRVHYEALARKHSVKLAAKKMIEDQQREARASAQMANGSASVAGVRGDADRSARKAPSSEAASQPIEAASGTA
jgi:hypothetical protein